MDFNHEPPVIEETMLPFAPCAGCGKGYDLRLYGFKTNAWGANRQVIPLCTTCVREMALYLVRSVDVIHQTL